jgi:hypothetical protein
MRTLLLLLSLTLAGCSSHIQTPENRVEQFYLFYLNAFVSDNHLDSPNSSQMRDYVAQDTLERLNEIQGIYEQEIIGADYFTYAQDYAKEWIPNLKVGRAKYFMGGEVVDVWIGIQDTKKNRLYVYLKMEEGKWKIYRVISLTDNYEQYIFDDKAIAAAKTYAASIVH